MLLRFTSPDILNTSLIDSSTGQVAYLIVTTESSSDSSPTSSHTQSSQADITDELRTTAVSDGEGNQLSQIAWRGRRPDITIGSEHVGTLADLFDTTSTKLLPKTLAIPTRFDERYIWAATATSLTLVEFDTNQTKGTFYQNALRSGDKKFISTRIPGVGHNYLEFESHPLAKDVEIIISFFMMEILRRGCFTHALTPYMFPSKRPRFWQLQDTKDLIVRKLHARRNTV
ncbi:rna-binding protein pno1 [Moniliophthora roreri MCA 2997]|uniref:Rna-binding protein pno1 n=1 Tax=Moniliophthora roreri (strain MCA 2997) TaxID=1381753 RepID=V2Y8Q9_MONRO|nr:rna-binding protein pno1 [Moniliophthora roreri MCA 2997]